MAPVRELVVAIHDVAPSTQEDVFFLLSALDDLRVSPRVLLVVPHEDGTRDLREAPSLCARLVQEQAAGGEIVLHGYTHRADGKLRGPWLDQLRARLFAGGAAEFLALSLREMQQRVERGREILSQVGCPPQGFCAPAWLALPDLEAVLKECGFSYLLHMASVEILATGSRIHLPWCGYMGSRGVQEYLVDIAGRFQSSVLSSYRAIATVFLHPQGARESAACRQVLQNLARLRERRELVTYGELVARSLRPLRVDPRSQ